MVNFKSFYLKLHQKWTSFVFSRDLFIYLGFLILTAAVWFIHGLRDIHQQQSKAESYEQYYQQRVDGRIHPGDTPTKTAVQTESNDSAIVAVEDTTVTVVNQ